MGNVRECSRKVELFQRRGVFACGYQPEIARLKNKRIRDDARPFDRILELTNVSGPVMLLYRRDRFYAQLRFTTAQGAQDGYYDRAQDQLFVLDLIERTLGERVAISHACGLGRRRSR